MYKHALAILDTAESWNWPTPPCMEQLGHHETKISASNFKTVFRRLLLCLIVESNWLGGTLLESFWDQLIKCHSQFPQNVEELRFAEYSSSSNSVQTFFGDIDPTTVDFSPVFELAADLFTHIGLAFMNLNDHNLRSFFSPYTTGFNSTGQVSPQPRKPSDDETLIFKALKRDGTSCPLSEVPYFSLGRINPALMHIIPCSIHSKPETIRYIALLAGNKAAAAVKRSLDTVDNALAMEPTMAASHRLSKWGIEARQWNGDSDNTMKANYVFRTFTSDPECRIGSIILRDGDEILLGNGPEGSELHYGPDPVLCNLRLSVGRALCHSGAAEFIGQLIRNADDSDCPHVTMDKNFHNILSAKLIISGRARLI